MEFLLILLVLILLGVLAPRYGVDSRGMDAGVGAPPDDKLWSRQP